MIRENIWHTKCMLGIEGNKETMQQQFGGYRVGSRGSSVCVLLRDFLLHPGHQGIYYLGRYWNRQLGLQCWLWSGCMPMAKSWSVSGAFWKERLWCGSTTMQVGAQPLHPLFFSPFKPATVSPGLAESEPRGPTCASPMLTGSFSTSLTCLSVVEYGWNVSLGVERDEYRGKRHRWGDRKDRV